MSCCQLARFTKDAIKEESGEHISMKWYGELQVKRAKETILTLIDTDKLFFIYITINLLLYKNIF